MQLILRTFELKLQHTFTISRQSFDSKKVLIVELKDGIYSGFGEASENPYYKQSVEEMFTALVKVKNQVESMNSYPPELFWEKVSPLLEDNMFSLCALDIAYHDLYTKRKGLKLFEYWNYDISKNIQTNFTIGIDSIEKMREKMRESPWPIYKIKLGTKEDLKIIRALRKETDALFRIDANGAWGVQETLDNAKELKKLGVEFLEQPLAADNIEGARKVFEQAELPIIADESCQVEKDVEACYELFHGVNIKLVKCGGLTPARRMIKNIKARNMLAMVGCMTESTIGISAIAHLVPDLDFVDLDGALLLRKDIAKGVSIEKGIITYAEENGTGAQLIDKHPLRIYK